MLLKKEEKKPDEFWREYEEKTGEKVLERGLGKYVSGWDEFDKKKWNSLWGLVINTTGGFRFHHFPQSNLYDALFHLAANEREPLQEKTLFLPKEKIISQTFIKEEKWWKRLFSQSAPQLVISYIEESSDNPGGKEKKLVFEAEYTKI